MMKKAFMSAWLAVALLLGQVANATSLCSVAVTTAQTGVAQTAVTGFGTPSSLTIQGRFTYVASSATSADVYVQSTVDGTNWIDIADFHWTTASASQVVNVTNAALTTPTAITDGSLASNTVLQGVLGAQYRCKVTSVGTYGAGTVIAVDVYARY